MDLIYELSENELLEITYLKNEPCIHHESVAYVEKMLRLHQDLQINVAGIAAVFNLLNQVDNLQAEVVALRKRLKIFEE